MFRVKGIIVPILTPLHEDESINETELRNQVNRLIKAGVHGIFPAGTNGEGYILSRDEKKTILKIVVDEVNGRVPVYAGTGCVSTKDTVEMSLFAEDVGVDALSIITPSFAKASQQELYEHYKTVAKAVSLPIVLYNIPARTGNHLEATTVEKLSRIENIVGVKDSSGDFNTMLGYIDATKGRDFAVLSGNDALILWNLLAGGAGSVSGCANVFPKTIAGIYESYVKNDLDRAKELQYKVYPLRACFKHGNPNTVIKKAVQLLGYPVGNCRKPFDLISDEGINMLQGVLDDNASLE
ncbi:MAG TPA: 4-hydroxy-tetrahydrodipicolinate synthase [Clostridia bacterium]|nr:4-hydroxy-tetrahydrodipicolinate synthase [Clostridia bacterium]